MFYLKKIRREIYLEPKHLGPNLQKHLKDVISRDSKGRCLGKLGYVITIVDIKDEDIRAGKINYDDGSVNFSVFFTALLFRPFENQVLEVVVTATNENGLYAQIGPLVIFINRHNIPNDFEYKDPYWRSSNDDMEIKENSLIRIRVIGIRFCPNNIEAIGTMEGTYLGLTEL